MGAQNADCESLPMPEVNNILKMLCWKYWRNRSQWWYYIILYLFVANTDWSCDKELVIFKLHLNFYEFYVSFSLFNFILNVSNFTTAAHVRPIFFCPFKQPISDEAATVSTRSRTYRKLERTEN